MDDPGNGAEFPERQVSFTALDSADVASVDLRFEGQVLLREPPGLSRGSNPFTQNLKRSLLQPYQAPGNEDYSSTDYNPHLACELL